MKMILSRSARPPQAKLHRAVLARRYSSSSFIQNVTRIDTPYQNMAVQHFRELAFNSGKPLLLKRPHDGPTSMQAIEKWFQPMSESHKSHLMDTASSYLQDFSMAHVPYELLYPQLREGVDDAVSNFMSFLVAGSDSTAGATLERTLASHLRQQLLMMDTRPRNTNANAHQQRLLRFDAPLALLIAALRYNSEVGEALRVRQLYIAQCSLSDLPPELSQDLPAPQLVREAGKGDIYASSIWLGLEPTYTPLHRDPNPNLFVQLHSSKIVRLLPPQDGDAVFRQVQTALGCRVGNSRIRGAEMMEGPEKELLHDAIWRQHSWQLQEAELSPGDALFIPKGWWHSVRSLSDDGRLNGSVNWWFR
jgi:hypothetical protein